MVNWIEVDQIEISINYDLSRSMAEQTYVARIRCIGVTAYAESYAAAVEKVVRMRRSYLNMKEAING